MEAYDKAMKKDPKLAKRIQHLRESSTRQMALHNQEMEAYDKAMKKDPKRAKRIEHVKKSSDRKFHKQEALSRNDIASLVGAIDAVKKGDVQALGRMQAALEKSMAASKASSGGFLYLIQ